MKRNMDLIRDILLQVETEGAARGKTPIISPTHGADEIEYHVELMKEAGLIDGYGSVREQGQDAVFSVGRLTWAGHDFLDAAREPERWATATSIATRAGGVTLDVMKDILVSLTTTTIKQLMGGDSS